MEMVRMTMDVPRALRIQIRGAAARRDVSMQRELVDRLSMAYGIVIKEDGTCEPSENGEEACRA